MFHISAKYKQFSRFQKTCVFRFKTNFLSNRKIEFAFMQKFQIVHFVQL